MWRRAAGWCLGLALLACSAGACLNGCASFGYRSTDMSLTLLNDGNNLLTIEGKVTLPEGSPIRARVYEKDLVVAQGQGLVENDAFCLTVDVSSAPGNAALDLEVVCDPALGSDEIKSVLGDHGQYMLGNQVEEQEQGFRLVERRRIVLPMSRRMAAFRRIECGDYALGVSNLEGVIEANPDDYLARAWLALALVQNNQGERKLGSRACQLLKSVPLQLLPQPLRKDCTVWVDRWSEEESIASALAQQAAMQQRAREQALLLRRSIIPGESLGGVFLGSAAADVLAMAPPEQFPQWKSGEVGYQMPDRPVKVIFDGTTRRVVQIYSDDPHLLLPEGLGDTRNWRRVLKNFPGGVEQVELERDLGDEETLVKFSYTHPSGIVFYVNRIKAAFGILSENIKAVAVFAPEYVSEPLPGEMDPVDDIMMEDNVATKPVRPAFDLHVDSVAPENNGTVSDDQELYQQDSEAEDYDAEEVEEEEASHLSPKKQN